MILHLRTQKQSVKEKKHTTEHSKYNPNFLLTINEKTLEATLPKMNGGFIFTSHLLIPTSCLSFD